MSLWALSLAILTGTYLGYAGLLTALLPTLIYPFAADDRVIPGFERVEVLVPGVEPVTVQLAEGAEGAPVHLFFMGNAGAAILFAPMVTGYAAEGARVVVMEYRGGGGVPGRSSEASLRADALAVADWAAGAGPLIVEGYSLGTGLAIEVAATRDDVAAVILTAPFDRLCRVMAARAWVPACVMPFVQRWDSLARAGEVTAPVLILHGAEDALIPAARSRPLAGALPDVERIVLPGLGHDDIGVAPEARAAIAAFLRRL